MYSLALLVCLLFSPLTAAAEPDWVFEWEHMLEEECWVGSTHK